MDKLVCIKDFSEASGKVFDKNAAIYFNCGADEEVTVQENRDAFNRWKIRPRFLRDVSVLNLTTTVLGKPVSMPIGISPTALHSMAHPDGEFASVSAADEMGTIFTLSIHSTRTIEDIAAKVPNLRKWLQLPLHKGREIMIDLIQRAEKVGFEAIVLSIDTAGLGKRRDMLRLPFEIPSNLTLVNLEKYADELVASEDSCDVRKYSDEGLELTLTWSFIGVLKQFTKLPIIVKGVQTAEDAELAINNGASAIFISNHGGRQIDTVMPTIEVLSEIVQAVKGRTEIFIDGGVMRGSDIFKALALGANMVFIGRPVLWGLAVGGQAGVKKVLTTLKEELENTMQLSGAPRIKDITSNFVRRVI